MSVAWDRGYRFPSLCRPTLKVHLPVAVRIEDVNDSPHEGVLLQLWNTHELIDRERAVLVEVKLLEAASETTNLVSLDCRESRGGEEGRGGGGGGGEGRRGEGGEGSERRGGSV